MLNDQGYDRRQASSLAKTKDTIVGKASSLAKCLRLLSVLGATRIGPVHVYIPPSISSDWSNAPDVRRGDRDCAFVSLVLYYDS